jgi:outer membrane protein
MIAFSEAAEIRASGLNVPGAQVSIPSNTTVGAEFGYYIRPNWAIAATVGIPPHAQIAGAGSVTPPGILGTITYAPAAIVTNYHFQLRRIRPYVGAGISPLIVFGTTDGLVKSLRVRNTVGPAAQVGIDVSLQGRFGIYFDAKKTRLRTTGSGLLGSIPVNATLKLDPLILSTGVNVRF